MANEPTPLPDVVTIADDTVTVAQTELAISQVKHRDYFFGTALILSLTGLCGIGVLFWYQYPQFEAGAMMVAYTLSNVISFVLGSKSGLATPTAKINAGAQPPTA